MRFAPSKYCFINKHWYKKTPFLGVEGLILIGVIALLSSCKNDSYDAGEGTLSYLHADYADVTIQNGTVTSAVTDDDVSLIMPADTKYGDGAAKDTVVRRLLYYTMHENSEPVTLKKTIPVAVVLPHDTSEIKPVLTDPVKLTSAWLSKNHKYINLQLGLMVGSNSDDAAKQMLGIVCDSVSTVGKGSIFLSLYHDQAGFEQYYTEDVYLSIPTSRVVPVIKGHSVSSVLPDTINVTVNTYSRKQVKQFIK